MHINNFFIARLLALALFWCEAASASLQVNSNDSVYRFEGQLWVYEDTSGTLSFEEVQQFDHEGNFSLSKSGSPNLGFSRSAFWIKATITNDLMYEQDWVLEVVYPPLDSIILHVVSEGGATRTIHAGDHLLFKERDIQVHNYAFQLKTAPSKDTTLYLRIQSESAMSVPITLYTPAAFAEYSSQSGLVSGLFYGLIIVIVLYNLFLYTAVRESSYLLYVIYILCLGMTQFTVRGYAYKYLWPDYVWWANVCIPFFASASVVAALRFSQVFLRSKELTPLIHKLVSYVLIPGFSFLMVSSLFGNYSFNIHAISLLTTSTLPVVIAMAINCWRAGNSAARYYLLAWVVLLLSSVIWILKILGLLPVNFVTTYAVQIGSAIETILLSFALGDRINLERKERYRAQKEALANLEKSNELKNDFMTTISHELRTPMNGVIGSLELIENASKQGQSIDTPLESAESSAYHMQSIIEDILCFSDVQAEKLTIIKDAFSLKSLLKPTLKYYENLCKTKALLFHFEADSGFDKIYIGDAHKINKIVSHLLDNAVKFTAQGEVKVSVVGTELTDGSKQNLLRFSITDSGIGISEELQPKIFQAFHQADNSLTRIHGGLGIGLTICKSLTDALGGQLNFSSSTNPNTSGTLFELELALEKASIVRSAPALREVGPSSKTIMVVEDNPVNLMILCNLVEKDGHKVIKASNGLEAVEKFNAEVIDLVFMDCQMPVMDGYEATRLIRETSDSIPIVAVTANAQESDRKLCFDSGMNDFISKPIKKGIIHDVISKWA